MPGHSPDNVPFFRCRASPYTVGDLVVQRPGQARGLDRADSADPLRFFNLVKRWSRLPDREEGVRIGVPAGGAVAPLRICPGICLHHTRSSVAVSHPYRGWCSAGMSCRSPRGHMTALAGRLFVVGRGAAAPGSAEEVQPEAGWATQVVRRRGRWPRTGAGSLAGCAGAGDRCGAAFRGPCVLFTHHDLSA